jgi:hypothetical protein
MTAPVAIEVGNRRLVWYGYGWRIERRVEIASGDRKGEQDWREDAPAYPATLAQAAEVLAERIAIDKLAAVDAGEILNLATLADEIEAAVEEIRQHFQEAAKIGAVLDQLKRGRKK